MNRMVIDARGLDLPELFLKLKEILTSKRGMEVFIKVLLDTHSATKKAKAFVSMTGCKADIEEKEGYYLLRITGSPCCV